MLSLEEVCVLLRKGSAQNTLTIRSELWRSSWCHITPDWLLIYKIESILTLTLTRTGTHALFELVKHGNPVLSFVDPLLVSSSGASATCS